MEVGGGGLHAPLELAQDLGVASLEETHGAVDRVAVLVPVDFGLAGPLAALDMEVEAELDRLGGQGVGAAADRKDLVHQVEGRVHRPHVAVGAQIARAVAHHVAGREYARERLGGNADEGILLVVLEQDIVARFEGLDLGGLEYEGLLLGLGDDALEVGDAAHQRLELAAPVVRPLLEIRTHPAAETLGLAYVYGFAVPVLHQINAGLGRQ